MDASLVRKLAGTWMFFIRSILGFSWVAISANRWSHDDLQRMLGVPSLLTLMQRRLASWIGHLVRMDLARVPRQVLFGMVTSRRFPSSTQTTRRHSYISPVSTRFCSNSLVLIFAFGLSRRRTDLFGLPQSKHFVLFLKLAVWAEPSMPYAWLCLGSERPRFTAAHF